MLSRLRNDIDIHTHTGPLRKDAIVCVDPTETDRLPEGDGLMSVGIHPWNAGRGYEPEVWTRMENWLSDPRVVAVGEAGLDRLKGPDMNLQEEVFVRQALMAVRKGLPLVIHCVRAADRLLGLRKNFVKLGEDENSQWIFHGFRGKPELARQLLDAGIDLSFGEKYNPDAYEMVAPERRYRETD